MTLFKAYVLLWIVRVKFWWLDRQMAKLRRLTIQLGAHAGALKTENRILRGEIAVRRRELRRR